MEPHKTRIPFIIVFAVSLLAIIISLKLFYVQVLASEKYSDDAINNRLQNVEVTPNRGIIYDRNNEAHGDQRGKNVGLYHAFCDP